MAETAVVVLFPELDALIGTLRRANTPDGAREMPPHATLLYPFADAGAVADLLPTVARELERFTPFELRFREVARFPDVLYLRPEPEAPLAGLTDALARAFPEFPPYGGTVDEIFPHVTVSRGADEVLDRARAALPAALDVTVRVERVWLMEDTAEG